MKKLLLGFIASILVACTGTIQNPQQAVYAAEQAYTVAGTVAIAYKQLPLCPQATKLCSSPAVVAKIQDADNRAYTLLVQAEAAVRSGGTNTQIAVLMAQEAVKTLTDLTATLGVK